MKEKLFLPGTESAEAGASEIGRELASVLFRSRRTIFAAALFGAVAGVAVKVVRGDLYRASMTVTAVSPGSSQSRLASVASQFGLGDVLPTTAGGISLSIEMISQLAGSDELLLAAADSISKIPALAAGISLPSPKADCWEEKALLAMRRRLGIGRSKQTNSISLTFLAQERTDAEEAVSVMLHILNRHLVELGRSQAALEREFAESRTASRRQALLDAETRVTRFIESNRQYQMSAEQTFEFERLSREVFMHQQVLTSLVQSAEEAGLREARDTPALVKVLSVRSSPSPVGPTLGMYIVGGVAILSLFSVLFLVVSLSWTRNRDRISSFLIHAR